MPDNVTSLFPGALMSVESMKLALSTGAEAIATARHGLSLGLDLMEAGQRAAVRGATLWLDKFQPTQGSSIRDLPPALLEDLLKMQRAIAGYPLERLEQGRNCLLADLEFIESLTDELPSQDWLEPVSEESVILETPGLRLIDFSRQGHHDIANYTVVFAPRAGNHSNIAEKLVVYLRANGLSRLAVVEQKCAEDIPLMVDGQRHYENFEGQVEQYRAVLAALKEKTGYPAHLIAICQPGPLLISTLILNPELGRTFGSAGSPMDTRAQVGLASGWALLMGKAFLDQWIKANTRTIGEGAPGAGRQVYDGRAQVLGFYLLGYERHWRNYRRMWSDLRHGRQESFERQKVFYQWYRYVHHLPLGFLHDTLHKVFLENQLINGTLEIGGRPVRLEEYPAQAPIWALAGEKDEIVPPRQAVGHLRHITSLPAEHKLELLSPSGHTGVYRSQKIFDEYYTRIIDFLLAHSDRS